MNLPSAACTLAVATFCAVTPAHAALKEGDPAPAFTARASLAGKPFDFSLKEALKDGPVVVYFYPAAFTNGCSLQAHGFAVNRDKFAAAGACIVGVSLDPIAKLNEFSADPASCAGQVAVASASAARSPRPMTWRCAMRCRAARTRAATPSIMVMPNASPSWWRAMGASRPR